MFILLLQLGESPSALFEGDETAFRKSHVAHLSRLSERTLMHTSGFQREEPKRENERGWPPPPKINKNENKDMK